MRIYLPSTLAELGHPEGLNPRVVHAVTPALRAALPEEDDEGLEYVAQLLAADDSVDLLATQPPADARWRRVVVAADVAEDLVVALDDDGEQTASAMRLTALVPWSDVACAHVDEASAEAEVRAAAEGDDDAAERLVERDLLWFDVSELAGLAR
ncbi:hypothetical protein [Actinotalea sp.]|uniref:DUF6912 family protein n=1 Tax=Actinotalea sp. TaxID=1872145 RepID=UPI0035621852